MQRRIELDFLRGAAILLVLGRHTWLDNKHVGFFSGFAMLWERFGWTGVDAFFVLSGFLIGGLLFKEIKQTGHLDVKRFLVRRMFKIWPAYYVFFTYVLIEQLFRFHKGWEGVKALIPNLLHIQNYVIMDPLRGQTWSLAVEEHFYLALPLLLWFLLRRQKNVHYLPWITLLVAGICLSLRCYNVAHHPFDVFRDLFATHIRIDSLLWGVLLAYCHTLRPEWLEVVRRHPLAVCVAGLCLISPMLYLDVTAPFVLTIGFTLLYLGYGCILLAIMHIPPQSIVFGWLGSRPVKAVAWIGTASYSIYLWHIDAGQHFVADHANWFVSSSPERSWLMAITVYMTMSIGVGWIMSKLIEQPALKLRERFAPSRTR